jgi:HSP20 family molecular chaperone IbpA
MRRDAAGWSGMPNRAPSKSLAKGFEMSRVPSLSSPFLLGFDEIERVLDRVTKGADGYPPYNIERLARDQSHPERLRITLAVAGFTREQLDVTVEENQLVIRGKQQDDKSRHYLHRGIAARQFQRTFVLADGMEVMGADLKNGLLSIDLARPEPERVVKTIDIAEHE